MTFFSVETAGANSWLLLHHRQAHALRVSPVSNPRYRRLPAFGREVIRMAREDGGGVGFRVASTNTDVIASLVSRVKGKVTNNKSNTYLLGIGAAGGLLLGRFLPVLLANVSGLAQGATRRDPFAGLIREHRQLLSLLDKMEQLPASDWAKRRFLFLAFKRTIGKHAMAEEDIVYPLLKTDAERHEATQKLYREHASMKIHLFELERAMHGEQEWREGVRALRSEIAPHAREEEEIEFPRLRELLDHAGKVELSRKIRQEEALVV